MFAMFWMVWKLCWWALGALLAGWLVWDGVRAMRRLPYDPTKEAPHDYPTGDPPDDYGGPWGPV
jgi:hypothetical protein